MSESPIYDVLVREFTLVAKKNADQKLLDETFTRKDRYISRKELEKLKAEVFSSELKRDIEVDLEKKRVFERSIIQILHTITKPEYQGKDVVYIIPGDVPELNQLLERAENKDYLLAKLAHKKTRSSKLIFKFQVVKNIPILVSIE